MPDIPQSITRSPLHDPSFTVRTNGIISMQVVVASGRDQPR
jgi:hypothetical protein